MLLPARAMNCENCHKWELLIIQLHRPSYFKNIRTTSITAFFISNKVVLNPYSHSAASDCQSFAHFLQVSCPLNRCLSHIQILCDLQIDNGIWQCINSSELEFSRTSLWHMVRILDSLHHISFQFIKNVSAANKSEKMDPM